MLKREFEKLKKAILREVKQYYKTRLVSCIIFGSVARGTPTNYSDIDLLIIAEKLPRGRVKRIREFEKIEDRLLNLLSKLVKLGIHTCISPVIKSRDEVEFGSPLFLDMIDDRVVLFDRNNFFKKKVNSLKKKLKNTGAKRVKKENYWYWILDPNMEL